IRPDAPENVFIGTNCGLAISTDSGATWIFVNPLRHDDNQSQQASKVWDVVVQAADAQAPHGIVDICGDRGHLRSTDGGATWTGAQELPPGRCSIAVSPHESHVLFAAATDHHIYESDDGGTTWTDLGTPDSGGESLGRPQFVVTNFRSSARRPDGSLVKRFDLWFGEFGLFWGSCVSRGLPTKAGAN